MTPTAVLMYHEIDHGAPLCDPSAGYARFVVTDRVFAAHMDALTAAGMRGVSLSQALDAYSQGGTPVVLTFDDGCATDRMAAVELLAPRGFGATFYVLAGKVGTPGYLSADDVRAIADVPSCEIGSHGWSHRFLSGLSDGDLHEELHESRRFLSALAGRPVVHLSCPGGRWSPHVAQMAGDAGYVTCSTSEVGLLLTQTDHLRIPRVAVRSGDGPAQVVQWGAGRGTTLPIVSDRLRRAVRGLVGDETYARLFRLLHR